MLSIAVAPSAVAPSRLVGRFTRMVSGSVSSAPRRYDIVVYGATGFGGLRCSCHLRYRFM